MKKLLNYRYYSTVQLQLHTRMFFCVVPLIFIAWVKSRSMYGLGPWPLVFLSMVTSMIPRE